MYKIYKFTIIILLLAANVNGQTFNTALTADVSKVCIGANFYLKANSSNATGFQFQIKKDAQFINLEGGAIDNQGNISIQISNVSSTGTYRLIIKKDTLQAVSNEITVIAQQVIITSQPINLTQCNGLNVDFRVAATGNAIQYQWQSSTDGTNFSNLSNSTKFVGVNTNNLQVKSLINTDHNTVYRCLIKDDIGCSSISNNALLAVNQLSTVVYPTTSTKFCEGNNANFTVTGLVGSSTSMQWSMKKTNETTYSNLSENAHSVGVNSQNLTINNINVDETAFKISVVFQNNLQSTAGAAIVGTCEKSATRTGYVVNPRPPTPASIANQSKCTNGNFTFQAPALYNWYNASVFVSSGTTFSSGNISNTQIYYYSVTDANGCESLKNQVTAEVVPKPAAVPMSYIPICPADLNFNLQITNIANNADKFSLLNSSMSKFANIVDANLSNSNTIALPEIKAAGSYDFYFVAKNSNKNCTSDTSKIILEVLSPISITGFSGNLNICETSNYQINANATGGGNLKYQWRKNGQNIAGATSNSLNLNNVSLADSGYYSLNLISQCEQKNSDTLHIFVLPKTIITSHPKTVLLCENSNAQFSISATGSGQLHYQWLDNGNNVGSDNNILNINQVSLSENNHQIKCKVWSDCLPAIESNAAILMVDDTPAVPTILDQGFCQNTGSHSLVYQKLPNHTVTWYDAQNNIINEPTISTAVPSNFQFYISQKDSNSCTSAKVSVKVDVDASIVLNTSISSPYVCDGGIINTTSDIVATVAPEYSKSNEFSLYNNNNFVLTQANNVFNVGAGNFEIIVKKGYCQAKKSFSIYPKLPEIKNGVTVQNTAVCKGTNAVLISKSTIKGGLFYWWLDSNTQAPIFVGDTLKLQAVNANSSYYSSYKIITDTIVCETIRSKADVNLKPDLIPQISIVTPSCFNVNNASISINILNGQSPFTFNLNGQINQTGIFYALGKGAFAFHINDTEGCTKDTTVLINSDRGPKIQQQPISIARCKGNTANFSFTGSDFSTIVWQKKMPTDSDFQDIPNSNATSFHLDNIGSSAFPHLSQFRVKLIKDSCIVISQDATLFVNSLSGTTTNAVVCEGSNINFDLSDFTILGSVTQYQWQFRAGSSGTFEDVVGQTNADIYLQNVTANQAGYYRNKLTFNNGDGTTCVINTSSTGNKLSIDLAETPVLGAGISICQGQSATISASNCTGTYRWSNGQTGATITVKPDVTTYYKVSCEKGQCIRNALDSIKVFVNLNIAIPPKIIIGKLNYCKKDTAQLVVQNCTGTVNWSNGMLGDTIKVVMLSNLTIYAKCSSDVCEASQSQTVNLHVGSDLSAGQISETSSVNCSGYNPGTITSLVDPSGGLNAKIQWQFSTNDTLWTNIAAANLVTYNPNGLTVSTSFRRAYSDSCQNLAYSNASKFLINPDPQISITTTKNVVCVNDTLNINATISGGVMPCEINWQQQEGQSDWVNIATGNALQITNKNSYLGKKINFRSTFDCNVSSCNKAYSNILNVSFENTNSDFNTNISDTTVCNGSSLILNSFNCNGQVIWPNGFIGSSINMQCKSDSILIVICKNTCQTISKQIKINVLPIVAKPVNTTPLNSVNILTFSATGQNLKWYADATTTTFSNTAPSFSTSGNYVYYVSQTINSCESDRLKINATISASLVVQTQPISQTNCAGNTVSFSVASAGSNLKYQWQRKLPTENSFINIDSSFTHLSGFQSSILKVSYVGDANNPHQSQYRCLVSDSSSSVISDAAVLNVNSAKGSLDNQSVCAGKSLILDLSQSHVLTGTVQKYQWQSRAGTGSAWIDLANSTDISGVETAKLTISNFSILQQYRCGITFSSSSGSCIESTDLMTATPSIMASDAPNLSFEFCQGSTSPKLNVTAPSGEKLEWLSDSTATNILSAQPSISTANAGTQYLFYRNTNAGNCAGKVAKITVTINAKPALPINTTPVTVAENQVLTFSATGQNLKWYADATTSTFSNTAPSYSTSGNYTYYVSQTINSCESDRLKINATISASLVVQTQPISQTNCAGNTVSFSVAAAGSNLKYQWQRKLPTENSFNIIDSSFTHLSGFQSSILKVSYVGDANNPHQSQYRCLVADSISSVISDAAVLNVNSAKGSFDNQSVCAGKSLILDLSQSHVLTGTVQKYQWQSRAGTGATWIDLVNSTEISGVETVKLTISNFSILQQYRCGITFASNSGSCIESTDLMTATPSTIASDAPNLSFEFCQGSTSPKLNVTAPSGEKLEWLSDSTATNILSAQPSISTANTGIQYLYYRNTNAGNCAGKVAKITVTINAKPALPINTTPLTVAENQVLTFSATGENLKWYSSKSTSNFQTQAPQFQKVGSYSYYVTQTNSFGCESLRLLITSEIVAEFGFSSQPVDEYNCDGNTVTFSVKVKGANNPVYQWQKYYPPTFINIEGATSKDLKIANVGDSLNPHLSKYRCVITDNQKVVYSDTVRLFVNKILSKISNFSSCQNDTLKWSMLKMGIQGKIKTIEWQSKDSTGFSTFYTQSDTLNHLIEFKNKENRLRVTFQNNGSASCVRYSNQFLIQIFAAPQKLISDTVFACLNSVTFNLGIDSTETVNWFVENNNKLNAVENPVTNAIGSKIYWIKRKNSDGCQSELEKVVLNVRPAPANSISKLSYQICLYENGNIVIPNSKFYVNEFDLNGQINTPILNYSQVGTQVNWQSISDVFGCESAKKSVAFNIKPCYLENTSDTCLVLQNQNGAVLNWADFTFQKSKIAISILQTLDNLVDFQINLLTSLQNHLNDNVGNYFYPKYFYINSKNGVIKDYKIRAYIHKNELENYPQNKMGNKVLLLNYPDSTIKCFINKNQNYCAVDSSHWQPSSDSLFFYAEFKTKNFGEFGLWQNSFPNSKISSSINRNNQIELKVEKDSNFKEGYYEIEKSENAKNWVFFKSISAADTVIIFVDNLPNETENLYRLIYHFPTKIKAILNTTSQILNAEIVPCEIMPNPILNAQEIKFYFPNATKSSFEISDILGRNFKIKNIVEQNGFFKITTSMTLNSGMYFMSAVNQAEHRCIRKFFVK